MFKAVKEFILKAKENALKVLSRIYISVKFLIIVGVICFIMIAISVFNPNLDANGNLVTIRTVFSSIMGCLLEQTSRKALATDSIVVFKNYSIGILAISITLLIGLTEIVQVSVNNPSIILLKNILFSSVGFLISGMNMYEE